ncbi:hypothetical protein PQX77_003206, partial [Marasmius sp. AFHP31]
MSTPEYTPNHEERVEDREELSELSDMEQGPRDTELDELEEKIERENEEWDRLAAGIRQGRMLTDAQWLATVDEVVGPLGDWLTDRLMERYRDRIERHPPNAAILEGAVLDMHPQLRFRLENAPPELRPVLSMNPEELRVLLTLYVDAHLNGENAPDFGYFLVSPELRPFLPNRPAIVEVLELNPEYVEVFGRQQIGDDLNILKSEKITDLPLLDLDPRKPGGSRETAIEIIPEDEPNPDALQNTPFSNVVLPRRRGEELPAEVRLANNPWDVGVLDPRQVPWHVRFPPRFDIELERRHYYNFNTGAFSSAAFMDQLLHRAVEVVTASYSGVSGERARILWEEELKPNDKCSRCFLAGIDCVPPRDADGEIFTPNCVHCSENKYQCSHRIQQDLFHICMKWGLIEEHNKDGLLSLALIKGKGMAEKRAKILENSTGPNFNRFYRTRVRRGLTSRGIFDIEYWTTQYVAQGSNGYKKKSK